MTQCGIRIILNGWLLHSGYLYGIVVLIISAYSAGWYVGIVLILVAIPYSLNGYCG